MNNILTPTHIAHLITEGFTDLQIDNLCTTSIIRSISENEARELGFLVKFADGDYRSDSGLLFRKPNGQPFQLRVDNPDKLKRPTDKKSPKYLSLTGTIDSDSVYLPDGTIAITEGIKDALAGTLHGLVSTGAVAGLTHIPHALPLGCGLVTIADYDAWVNAAVFTSLLRAGVHCQGKVTIVPQVAGEPKAGLCEYFKAGNTDEDYARLIADAVSPLTLIDRYIDRGLLLFNTTEIERKRDYITELATNAGKYWGVVYGAASAGVKGAIKDLLSSPQFAHYKLDFNAVCRDSYNTTATAKNRSDVDQKDKTSKSELMMEIGLTQSILFTSPKPEEIPCATITSETGVNIHVEVKSNAYKRWLHSRLRIESGCAAGSEETNTALNGLISAADDSGTVHQISYQRSYNIGDLYYLHLADDDRTVIEIGGGGWSICNNPPVKFIGSKYQSPLPIPRTGGDIKKLWNYVRIIDPKDRLLVLTWLVKSLLPGGTEPVLALAGYQGSGKSTSASYIRKLVDPFSKGDLLSRIPDASEKTAIHAQSRRIVAIDNLSSMSRRDSDFLCTMATGGSETKRALYTDSEEIAIDFKNLVLLTSIGHVITAPDLLERSLIINMTKMVDDDRKQEDTLLKNFDCDHPLLLGSLLDMAVKALNLIPTFDTPKYSRMGLFACIGEGIQRVSGYEKDSLKNRLAEGTDIAYHVSIEHSTVASTLILLMEMEPYQSGWQGTASQLLNLLKTTAKKTETHETLPKTAHTLTSELRKLESALDNFGIRIEYHRNMALRTLKISKFTSTSEQKKDPADPPNPDNIPDPTTIKLHIPQKDSILPKNDNEIPFVEEM